MMGFFSVYQGLIYNEFFAVSNDWFGTCFSVKDYQDEIDAGVDAKGVPFMDNDADCVYTFGMDPA